MILFRFFFRGCSSVGRASGWHSEGRRFDPVQLHQITRIFMFVIFSLAAFECFSLDSRKLLIPEEVFKNEQQKRYETQNFKIQIYHLENGELKNVTGTLRLKFSGNQNYVLEIYILVFIAMQLKNFNYLKITEIICYKFLNCVPMVMS